MFPELSYMDHKKAWHSKIEEVTHRKKASHMRERKSSTLQSFTYTSDILLGGLHMVHERHEERVCGKIMAQGGLQAMEAMLYTIDMANKEKAFID